jgi:hypothetical protein
MVVRHELAKCQLVAHVMVVYLLSHCSELSHGGSCERQKLMLIAAFALALGDKVFEDERSAL